MVLPPPTGGDAYGLCAYMGANWSPDGEWIAYISNEEGIPQLKTMKSWGGEQHVVHPVDRRQLPGLLGVPLPVPPLELAGDVPVLAPAVAEADGDVVDVVQRGHHAAELAVVRPTLFDPSGTSVEIAVGPSAILSHNHTHIVFRLPVGAGERLRDGRDGGGRWGWGCGAGDEPGRGSPPPTHRPPLP